MGSLTISCDWIALTFNYNLFLYYTKHAGYEKNYTNKIMLTLKLVWIMIARVELEQGLIPHGNMDLNDFFFIILL